MDKNFVWKPYLFFVGILALITLVINYKITIGLVLGTLYYFLNDKLIVKKVPSLDSKLKVTGSFLVIGIVQFILITAVALLSYWIGGLYSFFGSFAGITMPHFYYLIKQIFSIKK